MKLTKVTRKGIEAIFEMLRNILHEACISVIEITFQIRISKITDVVEEEDKVHLFFNVRRGLRKYHKLPRQIMGTNNTGKSRVRMSGAEQDTEPYMTTLRRTIYLTIRSSRLVNDCARRLLNIKLKPDQEILVCRIFLDYCTELHIYDKFIGIVASQLCFINNKYVTLFEKMFRVSYHTIHQFNMNNLRNISKFFAHLLVTNSISWRILACLKLNKRTTNSGKAFIRILFQEFLEGMGLSKLKQHIKNETLQKEFEGLFPKNNTKNMFFAIDFFASIGLGGLTDDLREHLSKSHPAHIDGNDK